jgi:hypothetical protein
MFTPHLPLRFEVSHIKCGPGLEFTKQQRIHLESDPRVCAPAYPPSISLCKLCTIRLSAAAGAYATNPATGEPIPIWVADYVLGGYGSGAIMAVPGHDARWVGNCRDVWVAGFELGDKWTLHGFALPGWRQGSRLCADYVLGGYSSGAIMAVPGHDAQ